MDTETQIRINGHSDMTFLKNLENSNLEKLINIRIYRGLSVNDNFLYKYFCNFIYIQVEINCFCQKQTP